MKRQGFTLIELLIVIAVLGILVSLILPRFGDVRKDANSKVCVANLRGLASSMAIYETRMNLDGTWGTSPWVVSNLVTWGYLSAAPYCPYEQGKASPTTYNLATGNPDTATCPNAGTYTDHKWP